MVEGPSSSCTESAVPTPAAACEASFGARCSGYMDIDLLKFMETGPFNEELCEWLLHPNVLYPEAP